MNAQHKQRLAHLMAQTSTPALVTSLLALDATAPRSREESMAFTWTINELERRFPEASAAVGAAYEEDERRLMAGEDGQEVDYVAVLLAHIPTA